jgi:hypothetical protein
MWQFFFSGWRWARTVIIVFLCGIFIVFYLNGKVAKVVDRNVNSQIDSGLNELVDAYPGPDQTGKDTLAKRDALAERFVARYKDKDPLMVLVVALSDDELSIQRKNALLRFAREAFKLPGAENRLCAMFSDPTIANKKGLFRMIDEQFVGPFPKSIPDAMIAAAKQDRKLLYAVVNCLGSYESEYGRLEKEFVEMLLEEDEALVTMSVIRLRESNPGLALKLGLNRDEVVDWAVVRERVRRYLKGTL